MPALFSLTVVVLACSQTIKPSRGSSNPEVLLDFHTDTLNPSSPRGSNVITLIDKKPAHVLLSFARVHPKPIESLYTGNPKGLVAPLDAESQIPKARATCLCSGRTNFATVQDPGFSCGISACFHGVCVCQCTHPCGYDKCSTNDNICEATISLALGQNMKSSPAKHL